MGFMGVRVYGDRGFMGVRVYGGLEVYGRLGFMWVGLEIVGYGVYEGLSR